MCSWHTKQYLYVEYTRPKTLTIIILLKKLSKHKWFLRFLSIFSHQCVYRPTQANTHAHIHLWKSTACRPLSTFPPIPLTYAILWCFCNNFFTTHNASNNKSFTISSHLAMRCKWLMMTALFFMALPVLMLIFSPLLWFDAKALISALLFFTQQFFTPQKSFLLD